MINDDFFLKKIIIREKTGPYISLSQKVSGFLIQIHVHVLTSIQIEKIPSALSQLLKVFSLIFFFFSFIFPSSNNIFRLFVVLLLVLLIIEYLVFL